MAGGDRDNSVLGLSHIRIFLTRDRQVAHEPEDQNHLPVAEATRILSYAYNCRAGEEALLRALIAERDSDHRKARFWLKVYHQTVEHNLP